MWMFKPFSGKEPVGLEGRTIDVGNVKVHVRNVIAEGGFSCVYVAQDAMHSSRHYALKHMICNDTETLDLVMKEIAVMKILRGHPNVVTLVAHIILDMGRRKEALLVMEFCEKSLVNVLESRGAGYFEEKHILLIFRDVCNAVHAMHSQSPPIAHRDLKAENILLGNDGAWKLCDFGSTSTNHKCFDKPEEMGIEEDNIRKHTTPAYRAPEMWDLFRRELICEKVDIWALGCLLYRICYLKSAFDGESKLQILNGNYRIPELPKYSSSLTGLIKEMLEASPNARPDIMQIWLRVNELLPEGLQKRAPDGYAGSMAMRPSALESQDNGVQRRNLIPRRSPPPPPSLQESAETHHFRPSPEVSKTGGPIGAFWSTQHAKDSAVIDKKGPLSDEPIKQAAVKQNRNTLISKVSPTRERSSQTRQPGKNAQVTCVRLDERTRTDGDIEINFFQDTEHSTTQRKVVNSEENPASENLTSDTFVADFDNQKLNSRISVSDNRTRKDELEAEIDKLKEQLKQANSEKAEITSKFEKLSTICRSQRQEIQELKRALAAASPLSISKDRPKCDDSAAVPREKIEGTIWELQQGMMVNPPPQRPELKTWNAFDENPQNQTVPKSNFPVSLGATTNGHQNTASAEHSRDLRGSNLESFTSPSGLQVPRSSAPGNSSQRFSSPVIKKKADSDQPSGWAGF